MLRLSNLADYGVVVMTAIAEASARNQLISATRLAAVTAVPAPTVAKLTGQLGRAGLLVSQRGAGGGVTLARNVQAITLADIVEAIDGPIALTHCGLDGSDCCTIADSCQVRPHWAPVNKAVRAALAGVSLAELAPQATLTTAPPIESQHQQQMVSA